MNNVSVCIATFNGEKFINAQLLSILDQIGRNDEVIIIDDCSSDTTIQKIEQIDDCRVRLIVLPETVGHVRAFEEALKNATNEIIFLSDQDDIWSDNKYIKVLARFAKEDPPCLVVHSLATMNEIGDLISDQWLSLPETSVRRFKFLLLELLKPRVFGSAAALKRNVLKIMLPFPKGVYAHDHWLTICASITGHSDLMKDVLVYRRVHNNNVTPVGGLNYYLKIRYRLLFIYLVLVAYFRILFRSYKDEK